MEENRIVAPTGDPHRVRAADGTLLTPPPDWALLPPGDSGLTRRVKAAGPTWTVIEQRGRKKFSRGIWAPQINIETARAALAVERADPAYTKRRAADSRRRERIQAEYVEDFRAVVVRFLAFAPAHADTATCLADAVSRHATPVGSGTVARTQRISIERRAEAAVLAWMRHQTTAYDTLRIPRVRGKRRQVRQELARISRALLDAHRGTRPHAGDCALCAALARSGEHQPSGE